jgi:hypothetical protein
VPPVAGPSVYRHLPAHLAEQLAALPPMPPRRAVSLAPAPQILTPAQLAVAYAALPPLRRPSTNAPRHSLVSFFFFFGSSGV